MFIITSKESLTVYKAGVCLVFIASFYLRGMEKIENNQKNEVCLEKFNANKEIDGIPLLFHAIYKGDAKEVSMLITLGANLKTQVFMNTSRTDCKPVTPFEYAKFLKKKEIVELLKTKKQEANIFFF